MTFCAILNSFLELVNMEKAVHDFPVWILFNKPNQVAPLQ